MAFTLTAANCPIPQRATDFLRVLDGENTTGNAPVSRRFVPASNLGLSSSKLNANFTMQDLLGRYGEPGVNSVAYGLTFVSAAALVATVAAGQSVMDGLVELPSNTTIALPDNSPRVFVWLKRDGTLDKTNNVLTPPVGQPATLLFSCKTDSPTGSITSVDYSGVCHCVGGVAIRDTGDAGKPTDAPAATTAFWTRTSGGAWFWDGTQYLMALDGLALNQDVIAVGESVVIPANYQSLLFNSLTVLGTETVLGRQRIIP